MTHNALNLGGENKDDNLNNSVLNQNHSNNFRNLNFGIAASNQHEVTIEVSYKTNKNASMSKATKSGSLMQVLEDVYLANEKWLKTNKRVCIKLGITHVIIEAKFSTQSLRDQFDVLEISEACEDTMTDGEPLGTGFGNLMILPGKKVIPEFNAGPDNSSNEMNPFMMMTG